MITKRRELVEGAVYHITARGNKIYTVSGLLKNRGYLIEDRPFRAPYHNAQ